MGAKFPMQANPGRRARTPFLPNYLLHAVGLNKLSQIKVGAACILDSFGKLARKPPLTDDERYLQR